jgi:hypothetical protein
MTPEELFAEKEPTKPKYPVLRGRISPALHRISWREVTRGLHYLYATTNPTRRYGKEKGWVWLDDSADVYHSFNNHGALGEYPSLEAAKRACETYHDLADDGFGVVHIPDDSLQGRT